MAALTTTAIQVEQERAAQAERVAAALSQRGQATEAGRVGGGAQVLRSRAEADRAALNRNVPVESGPVSYVARKEYATDRTETATYEPVRVTPGAGGGVVVEKYGLLYDAGERSQTARPFLKERVVVDAAGDIVSGEKYETYRKGGRDRAYLRERYGPTMKDTIARNSTGQVTRRESANLVTGEVVTRRRVPAQDVRTRENQGRPKDGVIVFENKVLPYQRPGVIVDQKTGRLVFVKSGGRATGTDAAFQVLGRPRRFTLYDQTFTRTEELSVVEQAKQAIGVRGPAGQEPSARRVATLTEYTIPNRASAALAGFANPDNFSSAKRQGYALSDSQEYPLTVSVTEEVQYAYPRAGFVERNTRSLQTVTAGIASIDAKGRELAEKNRRGEPGTQEFTTFIRKPVGEQARIAGEFYGGELARSVQDAGMKIEGVGARTRATGERLIRENPDQLFTPANRDFRPQRRAEAVQGVGTVLAIGGGAVQEEGRMLRESPVSGGVGEAVLVGTGFGIVGKVGKTAVVAGKVERAGVLVNRAGAGARTLRVAGRTVQAAEVTAGAGLGVVFVAQTGRELVGKSPAEQGAIGGQAAIQGAAFGAGTKLGARAVDAAPRVAAGSAAVGTKAAEGLIAVLPGGREGVLRGSKRRISKAQLRERKEAPRPVFRIESVRGDERVITVGGKGTAALRKSGRPFVTAVRAERVGAGVAVEPVRARAGKGDYVAELAKPGYERVIEPTSEPVRGTSARLRKGARAVPLGDQQFLEAARTARRPRAVLEVRGAMDALNTPVRVLEVEARPARLERPAGDAGAVRQVKRLPDFGNLGGPVRGVARGPVVGTPELAVLRSQGGRTETGFARGSPEDRALRARERLWVLVEARRQELEAASVPPRAPAPPVAQRPAVVVKSVPVAVVAPRSREGSQFGAVPRIDQGAGLISRRIQMERSAGAVSVVLREVQAVRSVARQESDVDTAIVPVERSRLDARSGFSTSRSRTPDFLEPEPPITERQEPERPGFPAPRITPRRVEQRRTRDVRVEEPIKPFTFELGAGRKLKLQGFRVEVKRRGAFVPESGQSFTREAAIKVGARAVDISSAQTFRLVPGGVASEMKGYGGALRKIKPVGKGVYRERLPFLIDSPGEFKEITLKGQLARRLRL